MPRIPKGPHLWLRAARYKDGKCTHQATWLIRDGQTKESTFCKKDEREAAEKKLAKYLAMKHAKRPLATGVEEEDVYIADVIRHYLTSRSEWLDSMKPFRRKSWLAVYQRLNNFWGKLTVAEINQENSKRYKKDRKDTTTRNELIALKAAVNFAAKANIVNLRRHHNYDIPKPSPPRIHFLTLEEAIKMYKVARRRRRDFRSGKRGNLCATQVARFLVVGLMTGTRADRINRASFEREPGRPWIDLQNGIYYRRGDADFVSG
ncbi:hypothetical protein [Rhizobium sp. LjRoot258]|uniref:hypothetical protein n=1 Tax=Rhizobium sp. LjRoot258 TaxID=3342299 RepID=UPI003ECF1520